MVAVAIIAGLLIIFFPRGAHDAKTFIDTTRVEPATIADVVPPTDTINTAIDPAQVITSKVAVDPAPAETVKAIDCPAKYGHSDYRNLDLATIIDGKYIFFSQDEWDNMPATAREKCQIIGVVINVNDKPFAVALHDSEDTMTWFEGARRYGESRLPIESQCRALASQYHQVNKAITAFGGDKNPARAYWGKGLDYTAWFVNMGTGAVDCNTIKTGNSLRGCLKTIVN